MTVSLLSHLTCSKSTFHTETIRIKDAPKEVYGFFEYKYQPGSLYKCARKSDARRTTTVCSGHILVQMSPGAVTFYHIFAGSHTRNEKEGNRHLGFTLCQTYKPQNGSIRAQMPAWDTVNQKSGVRHVLIRSTSTLCSSSMESPLQQWVTAGGHGLRDHTEGRCFFAWQGRRKQWTS